jgi:hypothetical protein
MKQEFEAHLIGWWENRVMDFDECEACPHFIHRPAITGGPPERCYQDESECVVGDPLKDCPAMTRLFREVGI